MRLPRCVVTPTKLAEDLLLPDANNLFSFFLLLPRHPISPAPRRDHAQRRERRGDVPRGIGPHAAAHNQPRRGRSALLDIPPEQQAQDHGRELGVRDHTRGEAGGQERECQVHRELHRGREYGEAGVEEETRAAHIGDIPAYRYAFCVRVCASSFLPCSSSVRFSRLLFIFSLSLSFVLPITLAVCIRNLPPSCHELGRRKSFGSPHAAGFLFSLSCPISMLTFDHVFHPSAKSTRNTVPRESSTPTISAPCSWWRAKSVSRKASYRTTWTSW